MSPAGCWKASSQLFTTRQTRSESQAHRRFPDYKTYPESIDSLGHHGNIETRLINFGAIAGGIQHSKYFIVDRKEVFVGSQNFDWRSLEHIHELGLRINNKEIAGVYGDIFDLDWQLASDSSKSKKQIHIRINSI